MEYNGEAGLCNSRHASSGASFLCSNDFISKFLWDLFLWILFCVGSLNISHCYFPRTCGLYFLFPFIYTFSYQHLLSNRPPFDLQKLKVIVAGYNVEYSSLFLHYFIFSEYGNIVLLCFNGNSFSWGWHIPFFSNYLGTFLVLAFKSVCNASFYMVRAAFPRYRYDAYEIRLESIVTTFFRLLFLIQGFY
jgi:NADH:ubiquinone oxidoreductase subunit H